MFFQANNPVEQLIALASGLWVSRAVWAAARLGIADAVTEEGAEAGAVASAMGADPAHVARLMDALVSLGVFEAAGRGRYRHNDLSRLLRSDHPLSQRAFVDAIFGGAHYDAWGALDRSVQTGETAFDLLYGQPIFDWYSARPEPAALFARAMDGTTFIMEAALLAAWTPPPFTLAVDVGGSRGTLLASLLARQPEARGILFDLPDVVEAAGPPPLDRIERRGGSFFESVPEGGDLYILKQILHDWPDDKCAAILTNIRRAIAPGGRLAVMELVMDDEVSAGDPGYLMDLNMMVMTGGRERTEAQFADLFAAAGFRLQSVARTGLPMAVVQAVTA